MGEKIIAIPKFWEDIHEIEFVVHCTKSNLSS